MDLFSELNKNNNVIYSIEYKIQGDSFSFPLKQSRQNIRSISKLVLTLLVFALFENQNDFHSQKRIALDSKFYDFVKDYLDIYDKEQIEIIKRITIESLLNQTSGFRDETLLMKNEMKWLDGKDIVNTILNERLFKEWEGKFVYSNATGYLLSFLINKITGLSLINFAQKYLFDKLEIQNVAWEKYDGYEIGASGLMLNAYEVSKIVSLLFNDGKYCGKQIISSQSIKTILDYPGFVVDSHYVTSCLKPNKYGLFLWRQKDYYFINGADGQLVLFKTNGDYFVCLGKVKYSEKILGQLKTIFSN